MKKIIKSIAFFAGVAFFASCADKLNVTPPNNIYEEQIMNILEMVLMPTKRTSSR